MLIIKDAKKKIRKRKKFFFFCTKLKIRLNDDAENKMIKQRSKL